MRKGGKVIRGCFGGKDTVVSVSDKLNESAKAARTQPYYDPQNCNSVPIKTRKVVLALVD